ncbi:MAG: chorismate mutase [Actinobacteria bacterium]|nr:MAG: chorismate mutase [Actinomycetota bacterium]
MPAAVRAIRGATTVDLDTEDQVTTRVQALLDAILERNGLVKFPAAAARAMGLGDVPLLCARELGVVGAQPRCIRVLLHVSTGRKREDIQHVYLESAQGLRDDLPG